MLYYLFVSRSLVIYLHIEYRRGYHYTSNTRLSLDHSKRRRVITWPHNDWQPVCGVLCKSVVDTERVVVEWFRWRTSDSTRQVICWEKVI